MHLLAAVSGGKFYSKAPSRTEIIQLSQYGDPPVTKTQFKHQLLRPENLNFKFTGFNIPLQSLKSLFISNYERNVFYVLTTIHAP